MLVIERCACDGKVCLLWKGVLVMEGYSCNGKVWKGDCVAEEASLQDMANVEEFFTQETRNYLRRSQCRQIPPFVALIGHVAKDI